MCHNNVTNCFLDVDIERLISGLYNGLWIWYWINERVKKDKRCPKCKIEQNKKARQQYSEETKLYKILQERWLGAKDRAYNKGIPFTITKEDLLELWK